MKNGRTIAWLLLALFATAAAHVLLYYKGDLSRALVQRRTLLDLPAESVSRLDVERRTGPGSVLVRTSSWRLVEPYSAIVDEKTVLKLLDALSATDIEEGTGEQELLRLGRTREDFGLGEPQVKVSVSGGSATAVISFGTVTPGGDGYYAAVDGEAAVYVVPSNVYAAVDLPPEGFRRKSLFPVGVESAVAFDVKRGSGSFMRFAKEGDIWRMKHPQDAPASSARIRGFLAGVMSAEASSFVWPTGAVGEPSEATASLLAGYGLDPESAVTVTVRCADGLDRQVSFGKEAGSGAVYALAQNAGAVVKVDAALKDAALAETSNFMDMRLFPLDEQSVSRISVTDGDATYLLARGEDGSWLLDAPVAAATDAASVSRLLGRILSLKTTDVATNGVAISITTNVPPVTVARSAALGGFRLEDLRSREILRVDPAAARRVVVTRGQGGRPTSVVYDKDRRAWNVELSEKTGTVSVPAVEGVLAALNPLRAEWIVKLKVSASDLRGYGLDAPKLVVAVDQGKDDAVRRNILVGGEAQGGRYATLGAADAVFVISTDLVDRLAAPIVAE